ncbi:MarR family winged helix-turn-helix transcriptional regulator, partial [Methanobrevibacter sp.]
MSLPSQFKKENYNNILIYHYVEELISSFVEFADKNLKDDIISTNNLRFLLRIRFADKTTQKDLVNLFKVSNGYTAKILQNFEENELIRRFEDPTNRRQKIVELTPKGMEKT